MGKFIEWSESLSVGIEELDDQHKNLVEMVNRMHEAIHERHGSEAVQSILAELANYTVIHFAVEEALMRLLDYPDYEEHFAIHKELVDQVLYLQAKVASGKTAVSFELLHFLKTWLTKHILQEDMAYSEFFINAGASKKRKSKSWLRRLWEGT
jgi:hemerythrin